MVNKIILIDIPYSSMHDLITFNKYVSISDIERVIKEVINNNKEYTYKDIYKALEELAPFQAELVNRYDVIKY